MKIPTMILMVFVFGFVNTIAQSTADRTTVAAIRDTYKKVNEQIAEMEKAPRLSSIFVTELVVNKNNGSYPAVGIYNSTVRFYYTYGDREKNPYPDRLIKITVVTRRSSRTESSEYLFSESGEVVFGFEKKNGIEKRAYYNSERLIRLLNGDASISTKSAEARSTAAAFSNTGKRLKAAFVNSLEE